MASERKTVLVADPDINIRNLLLKELTLEGFKVETVASGVELLQKFYRVDADALVVEAELPDVETGRIIDTVKRSSPGLPIMVIAANRSEEFEKVIRAKGIFYYATKPFSIELFKIAVKDALARRPGLKYSKEPDSEAKILRKSKAEKLGNIDENF